MWGEDVFIDGESALYTAVKKIRRALGEHATLLQTVSGRGYRIRADGATTLSFASPSQARRLAVLPLVNLSSKVEQEYFSAGLTEELIATLAKLMRGRLSIIARTSVMRFRNTNVPAPEIAAQLGAHYLLEGSVRRENNRVRITVHLLHGGDGTTLWSETFERGIEDTFSLQREISVAIAAATRINVTSETHDEVVNSVDPQVQDLNLRARFLWAQRTRPTIETAMRLYREALALDHTYAPAYAGLSCCYALLPITSLARPHESFPQAKSLAEQAVHLDPSQGEAYISLGLEAFWYRRDWEEAFRCFRQAQLLNPADSAPVMFLAHIHSVLQQHDEAIATILGAHRMDPLSPIVATHIGHFLYNAGRYAEALTPLERVLEIAPQFWIAHLMRGKVLASLGRTEEALEAFAASEQFGVGHTEPLSFRSFTLAEIGRTEEAEILLQTLLEASPSAPPMHVALAHLGLKDRAAAERNIDQAFAEHDVRLVFTAVEHRWKLLGDVAYSNLLSRAGLPNSPDLALA